MEKTEGTKAAHTIVVKNHVVLIVDIDEDEISQGRIDAGTDMNTNAEGLRMRTEKH